METTVAGHRDFAEFYAAAFHPLATQLYLHTGSTAEAQDVVQEAMCRAYDRWSVVAEHDDPVAWVRRVAWNLATSRWRRMRRGIELLTRDRLVESTPGPGPDRIAVAVALTTLPARQRQAVILHYLEDLSIAEIAVVTGAAEGTVKSWLHRARNALAAQLSEAIPAAEEVDRV
ncbi:SigE family RNA polymerase sigma factor [Catellatospora sp. NPDC049609]|uniref:SigE family RNA polymerase sigma factor n=1 Tax=Catellatospora sp. NPDC049609 TaxID=3155505 RepID=UPI003447096D